MNNPMRKLTIVCTAAFLAFTVSLNISTQSPPYEELDSAPWTAGVQADLEITGVTGNWTHIFRYLFKEEDGLATLVGISPCRFSLMTMGQPHSHVAGVEEIWFAVDRETDILLGKQLRKPPPSMAYMIPSNGMTPHSNINTTKQTIMLFWLMHIPSNEIMNSEGFPIRRLEKD